MRSWVLIYKLGLANMPNHEYHLMVQYTIEFAVQYGIYPLS